MVDDPVIRCMFCGKSQEQVLILITGMHKFAVICDECVDIAAATVAEKRAEAGSPS